MKSVFAAASAAFLVAAAPQAATPPRSSPQPAPLPGAQAQRPQPAQQAPRIPTRVTTKAWLGLCTSDAGACMTYVLGTADAYSSALVAAGRPQVFCFPQGTSNQQISQASVQYLRARPLEGTNNAALSLLNAFATIYPCPR